MACLDRAARASRGRRQARRSHRRLCAAGPSRDPDAPAATQEIYALYVDPAHLRTGVGKLLLQRAIDDAIDEDVGTLSLWVLEQNPAARAFYESQGFVADGCSKLESVGGASLPELRYRLVLGR